MKRIVIASNNAHKIDEIRAILDLPGCEFVSLRESGLESDPEEDGADFLANAAIKARALHEAYGVAALADDSGLVVDALGGAPGVMSARYAGTHGDDAANNAKLLAELADVPVEDRQAHFACVVVFVDEDGREWSAEGRVTGSIAFEPKGEGGFGYDPLFLPDGFDGRSMAELGPEVKNGISHRARALAALKEQLAGEL